MAIEIVSFPIKNGGSFHSYVSLPEGIPLAMDAFHDFHASWKWDGGIGCTTTGRPDFPTVLDEIRRKFWGLQHSIKIIKIKWYILKHWETVEQFLVDCIDCIITIYTNLLSRSPTFGALVTLVELFI